MDGGRDLARHKEEYTVGRASGVRLDRWKAKTEA